MNCKRARDLPKLLSKAYRNQTCTGRYSAAPKAYVMSDSYDTFCLSYWRVIGRKVDDARFIDAFYDRFLSQSAEIADKFANTDFERQKEMLLLSLIHVASYYTTGGPGHILHKLARLHNELRIGPHLYDVWFDSLLKTVEVYDPEYHASVGESWRRVLAPGVEFMKSKCSDE